LFEQVRGSFCLPCVIPVLLHETLMNNYNTSLQVQRYNGANVIHHFVRKFSLLTFNYVSTYLLPHHGDCGFIGITPAGHLYVEEFYGDDRLAQHHLDANGNMLASVDETSDADFRLLPLPEYLTRPERINKALPLNYIGARHRGLRE